METPTDKPRFAAMRLVPRVSGEEIQTLVRERLATEAVIKTDGWQGYSGLDKRGYIHIPWSLAKTPSVSGLSSPSMYSDPL